MSYRRSEVITQRRPEDVQKTSLYGPYKAKKRPTDKDFCTWVLASMNVMLLKWPQHHSRLTIRKKGIWITRRIYFFHQTFYQFLFIFHQFNKFLSSKLINFTVKLAMRQEKKLISSDHKTMQKLYFYLVYTFLRIK